MTASDTRAPEVREPVVAARPRRRRVRRLLIAVLLLGLLAGLAGAIANVVLVGRLERIDGAFDGLADRPPQAAGRTFLMVGTRPGTAGPDVPWLEGAQSVEAVMIVDVAPDGRSARVETVPARAGIASVATTGDPSATVAAVESWTGQRVDHLIAIDWQTFVRLAEHNGVDPAYDYGSGPAVQHAYLQRVMEGTLHQELRKEPLNLYRALSTTIDGTAVDDDWSVLELDLLLFSLRNLRSLDISYGMAPRG
jgi:hypothetical protein